MLTVQLFKKTFNKKFTDAHMKQIKSYGAFILGAIFLYDFIITFSSDGAEPFDVIGMEVSKTTYLAYLVAVAISFISYGFRKQLEERDEDKAILSNDKPMDH